MMCPTLACGPYIPDYWWVAVVTYVVLKPLAYFAFIQAFRYRVSRAIPMSFRQAALLTGFRAGLGIVFFGAGFAAVAIVQRDSMIVYSWVYLYAERLVSWFIVGWRGAALRGRRLVGWCISGTLINAAFDFAVLAGLFEQWWYSAATAVGVIIFIAGLHTIGRRASLQARFTPLATCSRCRYELTGNLSGSCPECGTPIALPA